jgi:ABC-type histidine transport system ATPase subunit
MPDPSPDTPVIEIHDLHKSYGQLEVLKGVDLMAPRGHVVSLIGSSGSGKSTLLRCCNLLEDSQQGEIRFEGEAVRWKGEGLGRHPADRDQVTRIRTNLSMVFQQFNLWSHMTILQNVMEAPVTVLKRDPKEVEEKARNIWPRSASATRPMPGPRSCRAASSSAPPSPAPCAWSRARFCSMNRPLRLTPNWSRKWSA